MGQVIQFNNHQKDSGTAAQSRDSFVPIEFAVGVNDRDACIARIAKYGMCAIHIRRIRDEQDALVYLVRISDAIWFNRQILEYEALTDQEILQRVDLIQMLENVDATIMDRIWASFTQQGTGI